MPPLVEATIDWQVTGHRRIVQDEAVSSLLKHGLEQEGQTGHWEFAVRFVDDGEMARLHEQYLNDSSPTDIITFPYDANDGEAGGDIVISVDTAARNARAHGWTSSEEVDFLILHGLLHILGWDDLGDGDRTLMLDRQHHILGSWDRPGSGR